MGRNLTQSFVEMAKMTRDSIDTENHFLKSQTAERNKTRMVIDSGGE